MGTGVGPDGASSSVFDPNNPAANGSTDPTVGGSAQAVFDCDPDAAPTSTAWRRLTRRQYEQTLEDLLAELVGGADFEAVWEAVQAPLGAVPEEERFESPEDLHGSYRRLSQSVNQSLVDAWYEVAKAAAEALTQPGRIEEVFGPCASDANASNDAECVDGLLTTWGARVLRRPLDEETLAFHRGFYGDELGQQTLRAGFTDVLTGLLSAPQMVYQIEHGGDPSDGEGMYRLDAYELASRLSYHFWGTLPDDALWQLAESGALLNQAEYERQVERMFDDPRTRATLREFYRDWLKLEDLPELDKNVGFPRFDAFAGADVPGPDLREEAIEEVLDLVDYVTWEQNGGVEEILTTPLSFAQSDALAGLYGIEPWSGDGTPPSFAEGERPGLLTRVALLATGSPTTRPIMKGVFIRKYLLCEHIPPPPENAGILPEEQEDEMSTRGLVEALTEEPGSSCAGCHATLINPLGFATEGFDALGRARSTQVLFDDEGQEVGEADVDTFSIPQVVLGDDTESEGPESMTELLIESGKVHACMARNYFRFTFGRWEDPAQDGCVLEQLRLAIAEDASLREMLRAVALTDAFKSRNFNQENP